MKLAKRLEALQGNVFADMDRAKAKAIASGKKIIDLSLGSSDLPTADHVLGAIEKSLRDPYQNGYLLHHETQAFRAAAARWYTEKFGVEVNHETEVLQLIGSQEGTGHFPLAILNEGDFALLQDPGYPSHYGGIHLAGGQVYTMPLLPENDFLPQFKDIPQPVLAQAKLMVLSYPHNPTTALAPLAFFQEAVAFCRHHNLVLVHDFPYPDLVFADQPTPPSILQADTNKELSIEFFTMSKSYNMGGFRVGYAIGNSELISALRKIKAMVDFNQYRGILNGAIAAMEGPQEQVKETVAIYQHRRDVFIEALAKIGWKVPLPKTAMYVWAKLPKAWENDSMGFCTQLVAATGVAAAPGAGFGKSGEGFVRFALVHQPAVLEMAVAKISSFYG